MRALAVAVAVVVAVGLALGGCGSATSGSDAPIMSTGLVLTLHFDHYQVQTVSLSGATFKSSRRFGPYVVAEDDLPRDSTVGFVFAPDDAGTAMVCGESHDDHGNVIQQACDTYDIIAEAVTKGSLTLN